MSQDKEKYSAAAWMASGMRKGPASTEAVSSCLLMPVCSLAMRFLLSFAYDIWVLRTVYCVCKVDAIYNILMYLK